MIGKNIKKLRLECKLTQAQLAEKLNCTAQSISAYENERREVDLATLERLADIFQVSIDELIRGKQEVLDVNEQIIEDSSLEQTSNNTYAKYKLDGTLLLPSNCVDCYRSSELLNRLLTMSRKTIFKFIVVNFIIMIIAVVIFLMGAFKNDFLNNLDSYFEFIIFIVTIAVYIYYNLRLTRRKIVYLDRDHKKVFYNVKDSNNLQSQDDGIKNELLTAEIKGIGNKINDILISLIFIYMTIVSIQLEQTNVNIVLVITLWFVNISLINIIRNTYYSTIQIELNQPGRFIPMTKYNYIKFASVKLVLNSILFLWFVMVLVKISKALIAVEVANTIIYNPLMVIILPIIYLIYLVIPNKKVNEEVAISIKQNVYQSKVHYLGYWMYALMLLIISRENYETVLVLVIINLFPFCLCASVVNIIVDKLIMKKRGGVKS